MLPAAMSRQSSRWIAQLLCFTTCVLCASAHAADKAAVLMKTDRDFAKATLERRLEGWMSYFNDTSVSMTRPPHVGTAAIRDYYGRLFADPDFKLEWHPTKGEMLPEGDLGYTTGEFEMTRKDEKGEKHVMRGNYITIWRRQPDGSWKIAGDVGSALPGAPAKPVKK